MNPNAEFIRLLQNLIRLGTVAEVDPVSARVRVASGELLTNWLPWLSTRAGQTRVWNPPTEGEQVLMLSPGGDPSTGVVLTGLFSDAHPAPSEDPGTTLFALPDDARIEYDHARHVLRLVLPGAIEIEAPGGTTWKGAIHHLGDMTREGSYTQTGGSMSHDGKNVGTDHVHGGVQSGSSKSKGPQ